MRPQDLALRLAVAALLGSLIGLERYRSDKAAGMRTHMLVSLGSALFMIVSRYGFNEMIGRAGVTLDPSRIASLVVSGIGFLGAGTILRQNDRVFGLTTAASVWAVAAVGLASGAGLYLAAFLATFLMLVILAVIKPLESAITQPHGRKTLILRIDRGVHSPLPQIETVVGQSRMTVKGIHIGPGDQPEESRLSLTLGHTDSPKFLSLIEQLYALPGVKGIHFENGHLT